jgi:hypothetical protein
MIYTHTHTHAYAQTFTHTHTHTRARAHVYTHTHTHTLTHTHILLHFGGSASTLLEWTTFHYTRNPRDISIPQDPQSQTWVTLAPAWKRALQRLAARMPVS